MSIYVMSDIHGEDELFHAMLKQIHFSEKDTLYILGDVIDRGPNGIALLQEIMKTSNMIMLCGNHEEMMLQCFNKKASALEFLRWNRNGNAATMSAFRRLNVEEQKSILAYLRSLPNHLRIQVDGIPYYLVHGFPSDNPDEELWKRPVLNEPNPIPGTRVIIGHTPVLNLVVPRNDLNRFIQIMDKRNEHPQILFARGYIDIDCGCSYGEPLKTLGCLRLEDLAEFYEISKTYPMQQSMRNAV